MKEPKLVEPQFEGNYAEIGRCLSDGYFALFKMYEKKENIWTSEVRLNINGND